MDSLTIRMPDDFHVHLREGTMLENMLEYTAQNFQRALVMPNLNNPVLTAADVINYRNEIERYNSWDFEPLMSIQITDSTTPEIVYEAKEAGAIAGKIYPRGMTTNSENGVLDYSELWSVFDAMEKCSMLLLLHGETPDPNVFCLDREKEFLQILSRIAREFSDLKIVLEHITTKQAVEFVQRMSEKVAATITVHHLYITLDDVIGGKLQPHNFCKPVAKLPEDRDALVQAAISGNPKFFLGTDSAPHLKGAKECSHGCAGILTTPIAMPLLAHLFDRMSAMDKLDPFTSQFGAQYYGLPLNKERMLIRRKDSVIPDEYNGVVPFMAGRKIDCTAERITGL